jgi:hypothetical protein
MFLSRSGVRDLGMCGGVGHAEGTRAELEREAELTKGLQAGHYLNANTEPALLPILQDMPTHFGPCNLGRSGLWVNRSNCWHEEGFGATDSV